MNNTVLLVDDDPDILSAYKRTLHRKFELFSAQSGSEGLNVLDDNGPFAAIVSDFRMPGMDGIQFLTQARALYPDTIRIMLTGQADMQAAIDSINQGNIFRFLNKPCPPDLLTETLYTALEQYRLINAERELLDQTLKGSVKVLIDILAVVNPLAFSKAEKYRDMSKKIAEHLNIKDSWEIELTAMLSQIGCVTVPEEILKKKLNNQALSSTEKEIYASHPRVGQKLLMNIPRLDGIAAAIATQFEAAGNPENMRNRSVAASIIIMLNDFDQLSQSGSISQALSTMQNQRNYDPLIMSAFTKEILSGWDLKFAELDFNDSGSAATRRPNSRSSIQILDIDDICAGMILDENIIDKDGRVLVTHPHRITDVLKLRLQNYARLGLIRKTVKVRRYYDENSSG